jgi:hypothetical protein
MLRHHDDTGGAGAVAPGVTDAFQDRLIAGFEVHLRGVEHERDLALEDRAEIERAGALHIRMRLAAGCGGCAGRADGGEPGPHIADADLAQITSFRRIFDHPADRAAGRRFERVRQVQGFAQALRACRR